KMQAGATEAQSAEVRNGVAETGVVHVERPRNPRLADSGVGVRDGKVADVLAELPLEMALLALPEQVGLVQSEEPADAGALSHRRAEVDVAGVLLGHPEDHVDVALVVGGPRVRE